MEQDDYDQWLADKKAEIALAEQEAAAALTSELGMDELMAQGESVYVARCAVCHQANGEGVTGAFPAIKGSAIALGDINPHIDIIVNGRSGTAMQAFANQLTEQEIAAVITYQRNAWGNDTGDVIQASDINQFKENAQSASDMEATQ
ncbi:cytochrome c oxidase polypeptide II [Vibrio astriarenae]|nr:cytochrome c oxidase polypeptide II [Vibrio sp. C7]